MTGELRVPSVQEMVIALLAAAAVAVLILLVFVVRQRERSLRVLEAAEARFESLVEHATDAILVVDRDAAVTYASPAVRSLFGFGPEELVGQSAFDFVHPDDLPTAAERLSAVAAGTSSGGALTIRVRDSHGSWLLVETRFSDRLEDPALHGIVITAHDVTDRRRVEDALRESEEQYRAFFQRNQATMFLVDPTSGVIVDANAAAAEFYGYGREALLLLRIDDLRAMTKDEVVEEMRAASEERRRHFNLRHRLADGRVRDVEVFSGPVTVGGRALIYSIVTDVTERHLVEEALREAELRFRTLVEELPVITYMDEATEDDPNDVVPAYMSPQIESILGYTPEEWIADPELWVKVVHPEDRERVSNEGDRARLAGLPYNADYRMTAKDGHVVWIREQSVPITDAHGSTRFWQGVMLDITERRRTEEAVRESERRFRAVFDGAAIGSARLDLSGRILEVNAAFTRLLGYSAKEANALGFDDLVAGDDTEGMVLFGELASGVRDRFEIERRYRRKDGDFIWGHLSASLVRGDEGRPSFAIGMIEDVTARRLAEEELSHRAMHDPLTGLPNRELFADRLSVALSRLRRRASSVAVMFIDLDRFKEVNDGLGHEAGDRLLVAVARRMEAGIRPADTVARFGGDEFVILCEDADAAAAAHVAERVRETLELPVPLGEMDVTVEASIGIALTTDPGKRPELLVHEADVAMYRAKELGRNRTELFAPTS